MQEQIYFSRNIYSDYIVVTGGVLMSFHCFLLKELIQFIKTNEIKLDFGEIFLLP